jgi:hypothetical protein
MVGVALTIIVIGVILTVSFIQAADDSERGKWGHGPKGQGR